MKRNDLMHPKTDEQEAECDAHIARECKNIQAAWTELDRQRRSYIRITVVTPPVLEDVGERWRASVW